MTPTLTEQHPLKHKGWILTGLSLAILMSSLDTSIVNVALPSLVKGLNTTFASVQWVVLSYLLVVTALIVGIGRLGDILGKRRLYLFGIALFTVASAACGLATSCGVLIVARAVQGLGAAIMMALSFALAGDLFPKKEMGKTMGLLSGMVSLGFAMGPSLGGLLIGSVGWPSIFLVNVPFGILACVVLGKFLPHTAPKPFSLGFDWIGTLILGIGLVAYALSMTSSEDRGFFDSIVIGLLILAGVFLFLFFKIEKRTAAPLVNLRLFNDPLLSTSLIMGVLIYAVMMSVVLIFPFFMAIVDRFSPQKIGLLLSFGPLVTTLTSFLAGATADRFGARQTMVGGIFILMLGCLLIATVDFRQRGPSESLPESVF